MELSPTGARKPFLLYHITVQAGNGQNEAAEAEGPVAPGTAFLLIKFDTSMIKFIIRDRGNHETRKNNH